MHQETTLSPGSDAWFDSLPWIDVDMRFHDWENPRNPPVTYHYRGNDDFEEIEIRCGDVSARGRLKGLSRSHFAVRAMLRRTLLISLIRQGGVENEYEDNIV